MTSRVGRKRHTAAAAAEPVASPPPPKTATSSVSPVRRPKVVRYRPTWHRVVGGIELAVGVLLIVLSYGPGLGYRLLGIAPIWYLMVGGALAYYSTFWFGWWDRAK